MYKKPSLTNNWYEKPLYKQSHKNDYTNNFYDFLQSLIKSISTKQKHIITARIPKLLSKKIYFFSLLNIKMERTIIDFGEKNTTGKEFTAMIIKKYLTQTTLTLMKY